MEAPHKCTALAHIVVPNNIPIFFLAREKVGEGRTYLS